MNTNQIALIIVAAGSSTRMGGQIKKEYLPLNDGTVLSSVALTFLKSNQICSITTVIPQNGTKDAQLAFYKDPQIKNITEKNKVPIYFVQGGSSRQESVFNALQFLKDKKQNYVLIHDGARPFLSQELVQKSIQYTIKYNASVPGITPVDTQNEIDQNGFINRHLKRSQLRAVQTPQGFDFNAILSAHQKAATDKIEYTDDTEIYDKYSGHKTFVFEGELKNKKITYKEDITTFQKENKMFCTGLGYDKHKLIEGRPLIIGGIQIPFEKGEDGHSDGDAVLHALTDALLGASHLGDIGSYFPDTDLKYKNADSKKLLAFAWNDVKNAGFQIENIDIVVLLEKPKFLPYREQVIQSIAQTLQIDQTRVFIKAKTGEKLGDVGQGNCIEVFATCLLSK